MESERHFLVRRSKSLPIRLTETDLYLGEIYDEVLGMWVDTVTHVPLVYDPNRPRPKTKKDDVETGEDQKGT